MSQQNVNEMLFMATSSVRMCKLSAQTSQNVTHQGKILSWNVTQGKSMSELRRNVLSAMWTNICKHLPQGIPTESETPSITLKGQTLACHIHLAGKLLFQL